jgi:DNA-directed RNA polymerase specialized sigma24 family protein
MTATEKGSFWIILLFFNEPAHGLPSASATVPIEPLLVELQDEVEAVELHLSVPERRVERRLASGETYSEIALDIGISDAALKVRVSRWRKRVHRHLAIDAA